jgi:hypothetical protein
MSGIGPTASGVPELRKASTCVYGGRGRVSELRKARPGKGMRHGWGKRVEQVGQRDRAHGLAGAGIEEGKYLCGGGGVLE